MLCDCGTISVVITVIIIVTVGFSVTVTVIIIVISSRSSWGKALKGNGRDCKAEEVAKSRIRFA